MRILFNFLIRLRFLLPSLLLCSSEKLQQDLARWKEIQGLNCSDRNAMAQLLWRNKEFRNLVIYRNRFHPIRRRLFALFYPPMQTLFLEAGEIGGGCFIQHGFSTMVTAKSIGKNFWVNQQVTIGYSGPGNAPVIGDDVTVTCGAKVLGPIHVGDHVLVGANAVVIRDVPSNCTVGGVPARIIKSN